jgi:hypothetical protein
VDNEMMASDEVGKIVRKTLFCGHNVIVPIHAIGEDDAIYRINVVVAGESIQKGLIQ